MIRDTSMEAFERILPKINDRQEQILLHLSRFGEQTNKMISHSIKLPINSVTPRTNELLKMGLIEVSKTDFCQAPVSDEKDRRKARYYKVTEKGWEKVDWIKRKEEDEQQTTEFTS